MAKHNLIMHITPMGCWRRSVEHLRKRIQIFDGIKIVAVSWGEGLDTIKDVQDTLPEIDEWIFQENDKELRETATLLPLLQLLKEKTAPNTATFYCHSKGVTREGSEAVRIWTELCFMHNLDRLPEVEKLLEIYPVVGTFKTKTRNIYFPKDALNHYSGTLFWFKTNELFSRTWQNVPQMRYGAEGYPGIIFSGGEMGNIFGQEPLGDMYRITEARKHKLKSEALGYVCP